jgi:hypothetical protein
MSFIFFKKLFFKKVTYSINLIRTNRSDFFLWLRVLAKVAKASLITW